MALDVQFQFKRWDICCCKEQRKCWLRKSAGAVLRLSSGGVSCVKNIYFFILFRGTHRLPFCYAGRERLWGWASCFQFPVVWPHHGGRAVHAHGRGENLSCPFQHSYLVVLILKIVSAPPLFKLEISIDFNSPLSLRPFRICSRRWFPTTAWGGFGLSGIRKVRSTWLPPSELPWPNSTLSPTVSSPPAWATRHWSPTREPVCWRGG